jgi:hypothetical protein
MENIPIISGIYITEINVISAILEDGSKQKLVLFVKKQKNLITANVKDVKNVARL